jgi:hypothetical protein
MLTISKTGFKVMPTISDNELAGIGLIAHNWSHLEFLLGAYVTAANNGQPYDSGRGNRASFIERARFLKEQAQAQLLPTWAKRIGSICDDALSIKTQRDQAVHGVWGSENGKTEVNQVSGGKGKQSRVIDFGKMRDFALKIDAINARILEVIISSCLEGKTEFSTGQESWKAMKKV